MTSPITQHSTALEALQGPLGSFSAFRKRFFFDGWLLVGILTSDRYRVRPAWRNDGPFMSEASPRRPVCGGAFSLPVHKKRPQNFDGEGGGAMLSQHQRVAANPPNLLARNRAPLGDSRGAFLFQCVRARGGDQNASDAILGLFSVLQI